MPKLLSQCVTQNGSAPDICASILVTLGLQTAIPIFSNIETYYALLYGIYFLYTIVWYGMLYDTLQSLYYNILYMRHYTYFPFAARYVPAQSLCHGCHGPPRCNSVFCARYAPARAPSRVRIAQIGTRMHLHKCLPDVLLRRDMRRIYIYMLFLIVYRNTFIFLHRDMRRIYIYSVFRRGPT